ncbi:hypothetical protein ACFSNO_29875 [Streptomyces cirratus]
MLFGGPRPRVGVHLLDGGKLLALAGGVQPGEQRAVGAVVAAGVVDVLVGADVGGVEVGVLAGQAQSEGAAEGVGDQHDPVDAQLAADVAGDLDGVLVHPGEAQFSLVGGTGAAQGLAGAARMSQRTIVKCFSQARVRGP